MKKLLLAIMAFFTVLTLSACGEEKVLTIYFVPSRDAAEILEATEPLKELLIEELADMGYDFDRVDIFVGSTYEAAAEAMVSGQAQIGFLPGGTYVLYSEDDLRDIDVALTATRGGLNKDFPDAKDWNDGTATTADETNQVTYYRGLVIAGPSAAGQAVATKVNNGDDLTWADLEGLTWCVRSATSSSGYIYPTIWLMEQFNKTFDDLPSAQVIQTDGYGTSMGNLAAESCDVATFYADARRDYADKWEDSAEGFGRSASIWTETNVIIVTDPIYNDTISVSADISIGLKFAIQQAFINIAETDAGLDIISIYSHQGYKVAEHSDYDNERIAQDLLGN
jgi:phosphonate transport system substrate-binding protein